MRAPESFGRVRADPHRSQASDGAGTKPAGKIRAIDPGVLEILACPSCGDGLRSVAGGDSASPDGALRCNGCARIYPIVGSVPRFASTNNYASNFGMQWNTFRSTQLDSHSGVPISRDRFLQQSGWTRQDLRGKLVLDVGCGAGRFAEVALSLGAKVVAIDYSSAVDACLANLGDSDRITVLQADVYHLPFKPEAFDYVYCFGVLQHTPDPEAAFKSIPRVLKAGGGIAIDVYPKLIRILCDTHYWLRPLTTRITQRKLFDIIQRVVPMILPISRRLGRIPFGRWLRHALPVSNYEGRYDLTEQQLREWAVLDTYDMLAPAHDHPQSRRTVERWFRQAGLRDVEIFRLGQWVGRGKKGSNAEPNGRTGVTA